MRGLLLVFTLTGGGGADGDRWFAPDKLQHFFTSAFVESMTYGVLRTGGLDHGAALGGASLTTLAVGVGKERYDARTGGDVSARDLVWDAAGGLSAALLLSRAPH